MCCSVLHRVTVCWMTKFAVYFFGTCLGSFLFFVLQCVAVCCSVLQYVAMCYSVLHCQILQCDVSARTWAASSFLPAGVKKNESTDIIATTVKASVAVCCSVLQCIAVCYNVLQCVAVCCSVLQFVAVPKNESADTIATTVNDSGKHSQQPAQSTFLRKRAL